MNSKNLNDLYSFDAKDLEIIKCQLNTETVHLAGIVERCKYGFPSIFLICPCSKNNFSFLDSEKKKDDLYQSVANVLWLSCPYLNRKIHELESSGKIKDIQDFINNDRELIEQIDSAHAHYYFLRKHVYKHFCDNSFIAENSSLFNIGIGGLKEINTIKCLHMHYAHYRLYNQNPIGRVVYTLLDKKIYCDEIECKKCLK